MNRTNRFRKRRHSSFRFWHGLCLGALCASAYFVIQSYRQAHSYRYWALHPPAAVPVEARAGFKRLIEYAQFRAEGTSIVLDSDELMTVVKSETLTQAFPQYRFVRFRNGRQSIPRIWAISISAGESWYLEDSKFVGDFLAHTRFRIRLRGDALQLDRIVRELLAYPGLPGDQIEQTGDQQWHIGAEQPTDWIDKFGTCTKSRFFEVNLDQDGFVETGMLVYKSVTKEPRTAK